MAEEGMTDSVALGVLIHRTGVLEDLVGVVNNKLDTLGNVYPSMVHLELVLQPFRDRITNLEEENKQKELAEQTRALETAKQTAAMKLAITVAVISPIISLIITLVLDNR